MEGQAYVVCPLPQPLAALLMKPVLLGCESQQPVVEETALGILHKLVRLHNSCSFLSVPSAIWRGGNHAAVTFVLADWHCNAHLAGLAVLSDTIGWYAGMASTSLHTYKPRPAACCKNNALTAHHSDHKHQLHQLKFLTVLLVFPRAGGACMATRRDERARPPHRAQHSDTGSRSSSELRRLDV